MYGFEIMVDFLIGFIDFPNIFGKEGLTLHLQLNGLIRRHGDINKRENLLKHGLFLTEIARAPDHNKLLQLLLLVNLLHRLEPNIRGLKSERVPLEQDRVTAGPIEHQIGDHPHNDHVLRGVVFDLVGVVVVLVDHLVGLWGFGDLLVDFQADEDLVGAHAPAGLLAALVLDFVVAWVG